MKNQQITSAKYTVLMIRVRQYKRKKAVVPRVICAKKMFGCSVIAHNPGGRFEQTGISIDAQDRGDVRKQDKTQDSQAQSIDTDVGSVSRM